MADTEASVTTPPSAFGGMEYGDWVQNFWWPAVTNQLSEGTQANYRTTLNNLVFPYFELQSLESISKSAVRHWVSELDSMGYKPSVIDSAVRVFRTTMAAAMAKGLITSNPLVGVKA